jgi:hypothetical protein
VVSSIYAGILLNALPVLEKGSRIKSTETIHVVTKDLAVEGWDPVGCAEFGRRVAAGRLEFHAQVYANSRAGFPIPLCFENFNRWKAITRST